MFSLVEKGPSSTDFSSSRLTSSLVRNAIFGWSTQSGMLGCALPFLIMTPRTRSESSVWPPGFFTIWTLLTSINPSSTTRLIASDRCLCNFGPRRSLPQSITFKSCSSRSLAAFVAISLMIAADFSVAFRYPSRIVLGWKPISINLSASARSAETRTSRVEIPSPMCWRCIFAASASVIIAGYSIPSSSTTSTGSLVTFITISGPLR